MIFPRDRNFLPRPRRKRRNPDRFREENLRSLRPRLGRRLNTRRRRLPENLRIDE